MIMMSEFEQMEPLDDPDYPDCQNDCRKSPAHIGYEEMRELPAFSGIEFFIKILAAPAETVGTENRQVECAERQKIVADDEVFKVQHVGIFSKRTELLPEVESENARHGKRRKDDTEDGTGFFTAPAEFVHAECRKVFKHGDQS